MTYSTRGITSGFQSSSFVRGHLNWKIFSPKTKPKTKWSRGLANSTLTFLYAAEIWLIGCCENRASDYWAASELSVASGYIQLWSLIANCLVLQLFLCSLPVYQRLTQQPLSVTLVTSSLANDALLKWLFTEQTRIEILYRWNVISSVSLR